jgi:hypothetical protein
MAATQKPRSLRLTSMLGVPSVQLAPSSVKSASFLRELSQSIQISTSFWWVRQEVENLLLRTWLRRSSETSTQSLLPLRAVRVKLSLTTWPSLRLVRLLTVRIIPTGRVRRSLMKCNNSWEANTLTKEWSVSLRQYGPLTISKSARESLVKSSSQILIFHCLDAAQQLGLLKTLRPRFSLTVSRAVRSSFTRTN